MRLHNGPNGYGTATKALHWVTVLALAAQFTVGYLMDVDDSGHGRGRGRGGTVGTAGTGGGAAAVGTTTCSRTGAIC